MPGVSFRLDDQVARDALGALRRVSIRPEGALHSIGAYMVKSTQRNIEQERSPEGEAWPRLSPRTAAQRIGKGRRRGFEHMLRVTNLLYSSISYQVPADGVEWGSNVDYARIHQLGGVVSIPERTATINLKKIRKKGGGVRSRFVRAGTKGAEARQVKIRAHQVRIPARPYLGLSAADRQEILQIVGDHIRAEVGQ